MSLFVGAGNCLYRERISRGIEQATLASAVGLLPSVLARIETGDYRPTFEIAVKLCDKLDLSPGVRRRLAESWSMPEQVALRKWKALSCPELARKEAIS